MIDPVLVYSTLLGGSSSDAVLAMAVDSAGAVYLAGFTASSDFPRTNPVQNLNGGGNDAFVAKLNAAGTALVYCTYLGGTGDDRAYGIAVDAAGSAYVTGSTASKNFPSQCVTGQTGGQQECVCGQTERAWQCLGLRHISGG